MGSVAFIQAKNYRPGPRGVPIDLIVVHTMEALEVSVKTAENVAKYFATTTRDASTHRNVDKDSQVMSVKDEDIAYGARRANRNGLQLELAGYAGQTAANWKDKDSLAILELGARISANWCHLYKIPVGRAKFRGPNDPFVVTRGFTGHVNVPLHGSHTDPGPNFPWDYFLKRVAHYYNPPAPPRVKTVPAWFKRILMAGSKGEDVKIVQRKIGAGRVDGDFGPQTTFLVRGWQKTHRLTADGVVGKITAMELGA